MRPSKIRLRRGLCAPLACVVVACGGHVDDATGDAGIEDSALVDSARPETAIDSARPDVPVDVDCSCPPSMTALGTRCSCPGTLCGYPICDQPNSLECSDGGLWADEGAVVHASVIGLPCTDDSVCDWTADGCDQCSNDLFATGTLFPSPICIGNRCEPGDGSAIAKCDRERGICVPIAGAGQCLPVCSFDDSGAWPTGCADKNQCRFAGYGFDTAGKLSGFGFCFGGCIVDADCSGGDVCQTETRLCVRSRVVFGKALGDPCVRGDDGKTCACAYTEKDRGYCTQACDVGGAACPTGFTCDAGLPIRDEKTGAVAFSKVPAGIAARCLKDCTSDADCSAYGGSTCVQDAGAARRTCRVLPSP